MFFSSHQLPEIEQLCDRAAFLNQGRVLHAGRMGELLREGAMVRITLRGLQREHSFVRQSAGALQPAPRAAREDLVFLLPLGQERGFMERAWAAGAELVRVEREQRSLEDLFARRVPPPKGPEKASEKRVK